MSYKNRRYVKIAFDNFKHECNECGEKEKLHVHHKDCDKENDNIENLVILCAKCHMAIHKLGKKLTKEHAKKSALSRTGIKRSEETKEKLRDKKIGELNPMYGKNGFEHHNALDKKVYETKSTTISNFRKTCKIKKWDYDNFEKVWDEKEFKYNKKFYFKEFCLGG